MIYTFRSWAGASEASGWCGKPYENESAPPTATAISTTTPVQTTAHPTTTDLPTCTDTQLYLQPDLPGKKCLRGYTICETVPYSKMSFFDWYFLVIFNAVQSNS